MFIVEPPFLITITVAFLGKTKFVTAAIIHLFSRKSKLISSKERMPVSFLQILKENF
jgi:hypothetical protein